jgi:hypothetical protein
MLGGIAGLIGPRSGRFDSATAQPIRNAPLATFTTFRLGHGPAHPQRPARHVHHVYQT